jgi:hypothetical protein
MRLASVLVLLPLAVIGCGGDDTCLTCDDAGSAVIDATDARAGDATVGDGGDGGRLDASADGATDGAIDGGDGGDAGAVALPGVALVSGGTVCASPKYRMIVSLGQGPGGNDSSASPKYRLKGGVVGATQPR